MPQKEDPSSKVKKLDYATPSAARNVDSPFKFKTSKLEVGLVLIVLAVLITLAKYFFRMD
jgi:hypothetical protein